MAKARTIVTKQERDGRERSGRVTGCRLCRTTAGRSCLTSSGSSLSPDAAADGRGRSTLTLSHSNFVILVPASHAKCAPARQCLPDLRLVVRCCNRVSAATAAAAILIIIIMLLPLLVPALLLAVASAHVTHPQQHIRFQDNAYSGITVSFSPDILNSHRELLIKELQLLFQRTSDLLYEASQKKAFFKEVSFIIPKSWSTSHWALVKTLGPKKTRTQTISSADFIVRNSALIDNPLTIQFAGCGKPGLQVQLSAKFINNQTLGKEEKSKVLLSNWAKYRYGVFDEHGFPGDKLYPLFWDTPGADVSQEKVTSCAATATGHILETIRTQNRTSDGAKCSLRVNAGTGHPDGVCIPAADREPGMNDDVVSSLLSHPGLRNNRFFCNRSNHNSKAPNKHNNLCEGSSVDEVISLHSDFTSSRPVDVSSDQRQIVFKLLQEEDARLTFIVDIHEHKKSEIAALTNALTRLKGSLNEVSEVLMLDMKDNNDVHWERNQPLPNWRPRNDFAAAVWGRTREGPVCLKCVMDVFEKSLTSLKTPGDTSSELVIVTEGNTNDKESDMDAIAEMLLRKEVPLRVVVFPYTRGANIEPIRELVSKVKGTIHLIPRDSRPQEQLVASQLRLFSAFDSFLTMNQNLLIARQTFDSASGLIQFNFQLDSSLFQSHIELVTQFYDTNGQGLFGSSYILIGEGNRSFSTKSREFNGVERKFVIPLNDARHGKWRLEIQASNETIIGVAYARVSAQSQTWTRPNPISGKCIISDLSNPGGRMHPPTLHVVLTQDQLSIVQNAHVRAIVYDEAGDILPGAENLILSDDGLGAPDVTEGDGIYSRYLTEVNQRGFYAVKVFVRSQSDSYLYTGSRDGDGVECCGSSMPKQTDRDAYNPSHNIASLERVIDCGFLFVDTKFNPEEFAERISDLRVTHVDKVARKVVIRFSEPIGASIQYETRMFPDSAYPRIRTAFDAYGEVVDGPALGPFPSHRDRNHSFNVSYKESGIYHIAIRVSNERQQTISNIVSFFMVPDPATLTTEGGLRGFGFEVWQVVAVAAITVIVIAISIACCICLCLKRKRRSSKDAEPQKNSFPAGNALHSNLTIQTTIGSSDNMSEKIAAGVVVNSGMHGMKLSSASSDRNLTFAHAEHMTVDVNNAMSPVQSWPAEVLLGHYGKVQQARERKESPPVVKIEDVLPDGSYSTGSDNPSHESSQYDDHMEHGYPVAMTSGPEWRYENVLFSHAQPAYVSPYGGIPQQVYGEPVHAYDPAHMAMWQERQFVPQRPQTPSDSSYPPDARYQQRRSNTVSQV